MRRPDLETFGVGRSALAAANKTEDAPDELEHDHRGVDVRSRQAQTLGETSSKRSRVGDRPGDDHRARAEPPPA
jgi:hypothetical protein